MMKKKKGGESRKTRYHKKQTKTQAWEPGAFLGKKGEKNRNTLGRGEIRANRQGLAFSRKKSLAKERARPTRQVSGTKRT